jgi:signal transduction histidine kinase
LEEYTAWKDIKILSKVLQAELNSLEEKCKLLASSGTPPSKIDADLVVVLNGTEVVYRQPPNLTDNIDTKLLQQSKGILYADSPILVASYSLNGKTLVIGEVMDGETIDGMSRMVGEKVTLKRGEVHAIELRTNGSRMIGLLPLKNMAGDSRFYLEVEFERKISSMGAEILGNVVLSFILVGIVLITAFLIILDRSVLSRLSTLTSSVVRVKESLDERIAIEGKDELSDLAKRINEMLDEVKRSYELKYTNETLRLINRIMRHDLVNNLSIIWGSAELLREECDNEHLHSIFRAVERCEKLIERMREFERCTAAGERKRISVRRVVEEVVGNYDSYGVEFVVKGDCEIEADEAFGSVVDNLITNAIIHGGSKRIEVSVERKEKECEIRIADFGKGIPDEIKEHIFEEGFKFGETGNTGLGLYIVKKVIEKYGGSIEVRDNELGGAIFVIRIRASD